MPSNPPTRRPRRASNGEPSLPIIPILIGVIVLGFVIGAGLSLAGRHDVAVVAVASPSAAALATLSPVTPAPTEKPTPQPTQGPAQDTDSPATAAPVPSVAATPHSRPAPRATFRAAAITASAAPSTAVAVTASVEPEAVRSATVPTAAAAAAKEAATAATAVPGASSVSSTSGVVQADSAFAKLSAAVVRQYLEAVKRGDQDGAYAALGTTPGAKGATLTEAGVVDSQTRVGRIDAHTAANDDALVSVQLQTANGPYFGQYTVHKTDTGAAVIVAHSIVKP